MKLTKRKEILTSEISFAFCETHFQRTVKHFKSISEEIAISLSTWLLEDPRESINTVDFDLQIRKFYNHDGVRERTWLYWTRRGWTEAEAKEKVTALQGSTRKQNIERLTVELGSVEAAIESVRSRDKRASHRCKEFWEAKGLDVNLSVAKVFASQQRIPTSETKEKIKRSSKRSMEYWLSVGMSETEAKDAVAKHQVTFSLASCISQFGEVEGRARWELRQKKWQNTLLSKPLEEQERINQSKMRKAGCISKIQLDLFEQLNFPGSRFGRKTSTNLGEKMLPLDETKE